MERAVDADANKGFEELMKALSKKAEEDPEGFKDALQKDLQKDDVDLSTPAL